MTTATPETGTDDLRAERSRRGRSNRNRGAVAERAVAKYLRANGFPGAERAIRAAYVGADHVLPDPGDITGTPGVVWQVKDCQRENIRDWLFETEQQRRAANASHGLLVTRQRGTADVGKWWCWMPLAALLELAASPPILWDMAPVRIELGIAVRLLRRAGYSDDSAVTE